MRAFVFACALASPFAILATALGGCKKSEPVAKAIACTEPCCAGNPDGIDCAENLELQCIEPDDACAGGRPFGCVNGEFFQSAMTTCEIEAGGNVDLGNDGGDRIVLPVDEAGNDAAEAGPEDAAPANGDGEVE